jgi:hypothetical protein
VGGPYQHAADVDGHGGVASWPEGVGIHGGVSVRPRAADQVAPPRITSKTVTQSRNAIRKANPTK